MNNAFLTRSEKNLSIDHSERVHDEAKKVLSVRRLGFSGHTIDDVSTNQNDKDKQNIKDTMKRRKSGRDTILSIKYLGGLNTVLPGCQEF